MQSSIKRQIKQLEGSINIVRFYFLHLFEKISIEGDEALRDEIEVQTYSWANTT